MVGLSIARLLSIGIAAAALAATAKGAMAESQSADRTRTQQNARNEAIAAHCGDRLGSALAEHVSFNSHQPWRSH